MRDIQNFLGAKLCLIKKRKGVSSKFCCPYGAPTFSEGGVDMLSSGKFTVFVYVDGACVGDGGSVTELNILWGISCSLLRC